MVKLYLIYFIYMKNCWNCSSRVTIPVWNTCYEWLANRWFNKTWEYYKCWDTRNETVKKIIWLFSVSEKLTVKLNYTCDYYQDN